MPSPATIGKNTPGATCQRCGAALQDWETCLACFLDAEPAPVAIEGFELGELIGQGGMGTVHRARQTRLDRTVAIKLVSSDGDQALLRKRFEREALVLAKLNHPNIVTVHDWGESEGTCYLVMEFVTGCSLAKLIPFGDADVLRVAIAVCDALMYAHERGVIHRDIKPGNVLVSSEERILVADFGIARLAGEDNASQTLTGSGVMLGTPYYMAPEILAGAPADPRSDIYSLGVLLYEMRTGSLPIGNFSPLSEPLGSIVHRALAADPNQRYGDVAQMRAELEAALPSTQPSEQHPVRVEPMHSEPPAALASAPAKRRWMWLVALVALLLVGVWQARDKSTPSRSVASNAPAILAADAPRRAAGVALASHLDAASGGTTARGIGATDASLAPNVDNASTQKVRAKRTGTLLVRAKPWANLTIDGKRVRRVEPPSGSFSLAVGPHRIVLSNPATGIKERKRVRIRAGKTTILEVDLRSRLRSPP